MGTFEARANTIRSRFKTQIADVENLLTAYDNAPVDETDPEEWVRCTILPADSVQASFGRTRRFRNPGVMVAQVFTLLEKGDKRAMEIVDLIVAAFRAVAVSDITFRTPTVTVVGRVEKWWQVNVNCPFYADDIA